MIHALGMKKLVALKPASIATNATSSTVIDTLGYDHCMLDITLDSQSSTTSAPAVLKLSESDDTTTTVTDVTAFVGGGAGGFTIPNSGSAATIVTFNVDLRARKRYLTLKVTPGDAAQICSAIANLSRGEQAPTSATLAGCAARVSG